MFLVCPAVASSAPDYQVILSAQNDVCTLLNAISDDPIFSSGYERDKEYWLPRIKRDPEAWAAFEAWRGDGIALAYLLSSSDGSLTLLSKKLADGGALDAEMTAGMDEPAYQPQFERLRQSRAGLARLFDLLNKAGFEKYWRRQALPVLKSKRKVFADVLRRALTRPVVETIALFAPLPPRREIFLSYFSGPYNFTLMRGRVCLKKDMDFDSAPPAIIHEWLHGYNPDPDITAAHERLKENDIFYAGAWQRIYVDHHEGKEEEFIIAAELYISVQTGLRSPKEALRYVRNTYGGLPLTSFLYDRLTSKYPWELPRDFDYNHFLRGAMNDAESLTGGLKPFFARLLEPISGIAGMKIEKSSGTLALNKVFSGFPAARAGFLERDVLEEIDGVKTSGLTVAQAVDLISGRPGDAFHLTVRRGSQNVRLILTLDAK